VMVLLAIAISLAFGSVGLAVGMRTNNPESVQSLFPLIFVFLFLSSMSLPRDLIQTDWFRTVATYNPVSYMIEFKGGIVTKRQGTVSFVLVRQEGEYRIRHLHWSSRRKRG
ncbi:MAG: ABC transporter permease, partial [Acidobacteria bacterium]|nr:ABC transporter permease [Acidobacteriota bacterium]